MVSTEQALLPDGSVFHDRYEVVRCMAKGGMGAVYEVIHRDTKRRRALKVMLPAITNDEQMRKRFRAEATVAAEVESEHIAETLDAGIDGKSGAPFIVMELLKGEELAQMLERRGPLPHDEVVTYLWQASLALDKTHAAGIVHRDLKPENLFVTRRDDGTACVKLLDFGIAKVIQGGALVKSTEGVIGTPLYVSPEQVTGKLMVSAQSDICALAQIAYTLLTGEAYWQSEQEGADSLFPLLMAVSEGPGQRASVRAFERTGTELPPTFDAWFAKATATNPDDRHRSCAELVDELAEALKTPAPATATTTSFPPPGASPTSQATHTGSGDTSRGTTSAVTATLPGGRPSPWPKTLAAAATLVAVGLLVWWLASDAPHVPIATSTSTAPRPAPSPPAAAAPSSAVPRLGHTAGSATATASASAAVSAAVSASASASVNPADISPRPISRPPRPPTAAQPSGGGWVPPVTER